MATCELCGKVLKNMSGLSGHRRLVHSVPTSGRRPHVGTDNVNIESLGHRAASRADVGPSTATVDTGPEAVWDGRIDGVPLEWLTDDALVIAIKGLRVILHERGLQ